MHIQSRREKPIFTKSSSNTNTDGWHRKVCCLNVFHSTIFWKPVQHGSCIFWEPLTHFHKRGKKTEADNSRARDNYFTPVGYDEDDAGEGGEREKVRFTNVNPSEDSSKSMQPMPLPTWLQHVDGTQQVQHPFFYSVNCRVHH